VFELEGYHAIVMTYSRGPLKSLRKFFAVQRKCYSVLQVF